MPSNVYFANLRARSEGENKITKIQKLFDKSGFSELMNENDLTAIKIHFGEIGNDSFINPVFVRQVVNKIKECKAKPYLTDTNTLYSGSRHNAVDHLETAILHGFDYAVTGAPLVIADGILGEDVKEVEINKKHFRFAKIAGGITAADSMIVMSHFKGHEMAGFGGAIKNLAMGCAPASGKRDQHSTRPIVNEQNCVGCEKCVKICPQEAAIVENKKSYIDRQKCIGCGECMTVCSVKAIELDWTVELKEFTEKLTEYAYGAVAGKEGKVGYINFLINITPDCDCVPWSDAPIVPDIGIVASKDPVALDQACLDLINKAKALNNSLLENHHHHENCHHDKFKSMRDNTCGDIQLSYGEELGLGNRQYNLIEI